jgi:hypothetical protein
VLVETVNTLYEVSFAHRSYRVVKHDTTTGDRQPGAWQHYDRMSPVRPGEPLRFFTALEERPPSLHYRVLTTAPVTKVLAA